MKAFIVLCIIAVAAAQQTVNLTPEQSTKLRGFHRECTGITHVNTELVAKARKGDFSEDKNLDAYFTCMFKKADFIDDAGKLKTDVIKSKAAGISEDDINHIFSECASAQSQPKEKVARAAYECYLHNPKAKFQILPETA